MFTAMRRLMSTTFPKRLERYCKKHGYKVDLSCLVDKERDALFKQIILHMYRDYSPLLMYITQNHLKNVYNFDLGTNLHVGVSKAE
jgi:alpha-galactosidase